MPGTTKKGEAPRRLVYVEWIDSASASEGRWVDLARISPDPMLIRSVGWVLHDTKEALTVVASISEEDGCSGDTTIPRVAIRRVVTLKAPRERGARAKR